VRRFALIVILALGIALIVLALLLIYSVRGSITTKSEIDPFSVLDIGVLLLAVVALGEYLRSASTHSQAKQTILLQEISATRASLTRAYESFTLFCGNPDSQDHFSNLTFSFKLLSQRLTALESAVVPGLRKEKAFLGPFLELKTSCTSSHQPTDDEQRLAESRMELLDHALVKLSVDVARSR